MTENQTDTLYVVYGAKPGCLPDYIVAYTAESDAQEDYNVQIRGDFDSLQFWIEIVSRGDIPDEDFESLLNETVGVSYE